MNKKSIITTLLTALFGLVSCSSDNDYKDKVEQVSVYVSAETGMFYNVPIKYPKMEVSDAQKENHGRIGSLERKS